MWRAIRDLPAPARGPAEGAGRLARALPFAIVGGLVLVLYVLSNVQDLQALELALLLGGAGALCAAWALAPWDSLPRSAQAVLPLGAIALVIMMQVFALPDDRDLGVLLVLPVLWAAIYASAREALVVVGAAVATVVSMQVVAGASSLPIGFTGPTEALGLSAALALLAWFTVAARAHARTDPLTRVPNRRAWDEVASAELERARRYPVPMALAIIDLDRFKEYNDTRGHADGDRHLAACAAEWSRCLRSTDVLARVGGEEFAVLLVGADEEIARGVLRRIMDSTPNGQTCSVGLALWDGAEDALELMARADEALYAAKARGRARLVLDPADPEPVAPRGEAPARAFARAA